MNSPIISLEINLPFKAERDPDDKLLYPTFGQHYFKVFICHGCQSCWEIIKDPNNPNQTRLKTNRPHIIGLSNITDEIKAIKDALQKHREADSGFFLTQPIDLDES